MEKLFGNINSNSNSNTPKKNAKKPNYYLTAHYSGSKSLDGFMTPLMKIGNSDTDRMMNESRFFCFSSSFLLGRPAEVIHLCHFISLTKQWQQRNKHKSTSILSIKYRKFVASVSFLMESDSQSCNSNVLC